MACKRTVQEWHQAIDLLTSSAADFAGVEEEILPILKYCYDNLNGEQVKSCFLYCSLYTEDLVLGKESLIDNWIAEGFIDEKDGREKALHQGYEIIGTLVHACLLLNLGTPYGNVRMHDVVRETALWIASDLGKHKERCIVQARLGLRKIPKLKKWKSLRRMSLMENKIEKISESPDCPQLTTLFLQNNNRLATISGEFFRSMPRLLVLDLSRNASLSGLPEQISGLVSLRYLNLSGTKIKLLPVGLQELKMLIYLNLERTSKLKKLDGISKFLSLRTLKLKDSKLWLDMSLMKELQLLEHLEWISISISSSLVGEQLLYDPRVGRCIQQISILERPQESVAVLVLQATRSLRCVSILDNCGTREIKIEKTPWNTSPCFSNLSKVVIGNCHGLKDVTWLLFAPNLIHLVLWELKQLEDLISKEKADSVLEETCNILPFLKLEHLYLRDLPELKSIYWNALPFQRLSFLFMDKNCPKLRKLPLDSKSVFKVEEFVIQYRGEEWMQRIEWEDEATRHRFLPSWKLLG